MNKEQQELIDEVYEKYSIIAGMSTQVMTLTKEEFIRYIKTDVIFSKQWELKIEERELNVDELNIVNLLKQTSTKLITVTYKNKTITSYEN